VGGADILADKLSRVPLELLIRLEEESKVWKALKNKNTDDADLSKIITANRLFGIFMQGELGCV
jgi:hypothetical protein